MSKRGDFSLSFGMIFSIIIMIAIIAVSFYVIKSFVFTSKCAEAGLFYNDLEEYIDEAWQSTIHQDTFKGSLPDGIEQVCFGNLTTIAIPTSQTEFDSLSRSFINNRDRNVFILPIEKACDTSLASLKLSHVKIPKFFCLEVKKGQIELKTQKTQFESLVTLTN